jgi:endonuclease-3
MIKEKKGTLDLDFLGQLTDSQAQAWLEELPGVGPKISAYVLNTSRLHMRSLIIDTHHLRVAKRLGLLRTEPQSRKAIASLERQIPNVWTADDVEDHHFMMKQIGQDFCIDGYLKCPLCPLQDICDYGKGTL